LATGRASTSRPPAEHAQAAVGRAASAGRRRSGWRIRTGEERWRTPAGGGAVADAGLPVHHAQPEMGGRRRRVPCSADGILQRGLRGGGHGSASGVEDKRERTSGGDAAWGKMTCGAGVLGGCGPLLQYCAGLAHPGWAAKLDLSFAARPGSGPFFVLTQQCGGGRSRSNKHRIRSISRLGGDFLSSPGLPNTPYLYLVLRSSTRPRDMFFVHFILCFCLKRIRGAEL
jgi:hypothetical protein